MKPRIPYVYRLTDRENGKRYIGSRYGKVCEPADLGVTYFTSRPEVAKLFKADPERFEKQIIVTGTKDYVIKVEFNLIELYDAVKSDEFYNRANCKTVHSEDCAKGASKVGKIWGPKMAEHHRLTGSGLYGLTKEQRTLAGRAGGKIGGAANAASGHISALGKKFCGIGGKAGGKVTGELSKLSGAIQSLAQSNNAKRYICLECGLKSTPSGIGRHHQISKHSGRERIL